MEQITKRDGRVVSFDKNKIVNAILRAMRETDIGEDISLANAIADKIENIAKPMNVEEIQDIVEYELMSSNRKDVARKYIIYRNDRNNARQSNSELFKTVREKITAEAVQNSNANVDESSFGGRKAEASAVIQKQIALNNLMSKDVAEAHINGLIYQHDLDSYAVGQHNCFSRSTRFNTTEGLYSFNDFNDGGRVEVYTHTGKISKATVRCYGKDEFQHLIFMRGDNQYDVFATKNHRWILSDGIVTDNIKIGDVLAVMPQDLQLCDGNILIDRDKSFVLRTILPGYTDETWCLEVDDDDKSFILKDGMVTGNCLHLDFKHILSNGFSTRNGDVRPPASFSTACQLVAVAFQCQSQDQFGGVGSVHIDTDLAPFVKMSFRKHFRNYYTDVLGYTSEQAESALKQLDPVEIDNAELKGQFGNQDAYSFAMKQLEREGKQSAQGLYHNLNTLESRAGSQVPFTSINMGRDTTTEGRLVTRWLLEASLDGIGKHHLTSIFPISIFCYKKGINTDPGDPNYDLKLLALKSLSRRIYPNFVNGDYSQAHEDPNDPDTIFSSMGCRTMLGYDRHGFGYSRVGRGNNIPITIILPKLAIEYGIALGERSEADLDGFWKAFEDTLRLTEKALVERFKYIAAQSPKSAHFMYGNGTIRGLQDGDTNVYNALKHNTLAIGYIGIAEMCQALFGANHVHSKKAFDFALKVVARINEFAKEASDRNDLNFSCYATPAESLCRTALVKLRSQYGVLKDITDREWLTNSHHVPVWEKISIYDKLRIEAPFCKYPTGGCITYVECESTFMQNIKAIESVIDYAMSIDIPYLAINFPIDSCLDCGYQGEFNDRCPECGSENIQQLRRVTGLSERNAPKCRKPLYADSPRQHLSREQKQNNNEEGIKR